jgi:hypothetical protein
MKNKLYILIFCCSFSFSAFAANEKKIEHSFEIDDLDSVKISESTEDSGANASKWREVWDRNITGSIAATYVAADQGARNTTYGNLRYETDQEYGSGLFSLKKFAVEGDITSYEIEFEQKIRQGISTEEKAGKTEKVTTSFKKTITELKEAYVDLGITSYATLSGGRKKIVWGQFEPYSPVDFVMPMNFSRQSVAFSKSSNRVPQDVVSLAVYPTSYIELEGYYFPGLFYDDVIEEMVDKGSSYNEAYADGSNIKYRRAQTNYNLPTGSDKPQTAARLMFYPSWATFGFTYYNGWDTNFPMSFSEMTLVKAEAGSNKSFYELQKPGLRAQEMVGFEFSKPLGDWTLKAEYASVRTQVDLKTDIAHASFDLTGHTLSAEKQAYRDWVKNINGNKLYVPVQEDFFALGFDWKGDRWNTTLVAFVLKENYDSKFQEGFDLAEKAYPEEDDFGEVFPLISVSRKMWDAKEDSIGFGAGILGPGVGFSTYYKGEIGESFTWLLSFESIEYFADDVLEDSNNDGVYEREKTEVDGARFSFLYKF